MLSKGCKGYSAFVQLNETEKHWPEANKIEITQAKSCAWGSCDFFTDFKGCSHIFTSIMNSGMMSMTSMNKELCIRRGLSSEAWRQNPRTHGPPLPHLSNETTPDQSTCESIL